MGWFDLRKVVEHHLLGGRLPIGLDPAVQLVSDARDANEIDLHRVLAFVALDIVHQQVEVVCDMLHLAFFELSINLD